MKTVKRKITVRIDAFPLRSVTNKHPIAIVDQATPDGWMPELLEGHLRNIVEVEITVPVLIEETVLSPVVADVATYTCRLCKKEPARTPGGLCDACEDHFGNERED